MYASIKLLQFQSSKKEELKFNWQSYWGGAQPECRNFQLVSRATCWWECKPQREEADSNLNAVLTQEIEIRLARDFDNQFYLREVFNTVLQLDPQKAPPIDYTVEMAITAHPVADNHQRGLTVGSLMISLWKSLNRPNPKFWSQHFFNWSYKFGWVHKFKTHPFSLLSAQLTKKGTQDYAKTKEGSSWCLIFAKKKKFHLILTKRA